jgi:hypothetical protein
MELKKSFFNRRFPEETLRKAMVLLDTFVPIDKTSQSQFLSLSIGEDQWVFDQIEDFFADYARADLCHLDYSRANASYKVTCSLMSYATIISIRCPHRHQVLAVMNIFQQALSLTTSLSPDEGDRPSDCTIFIGHGRSKAWRELKDHLVDMHSYKVEAFEVGARAGHQIRDILEDLLEKSSLAFLVLTGEDEMVDQQIRARQNVIHETGLFQGRLGFSKAIVLLENGVEEFSNLHGIQHIPFEKDHISGAFGHVLAVIKRETAQ